MFAYLQDNKSICKVQQYFIKEDEGIEPLQVLPVPLFSRQVADHLAASSMMQNIHDSSG